MLLITNGSFCSANRELTKDQNLQNNTEAAQKPFKTQWNDIIYSDKCRSAQSFVTLNFCTRSENFFHRISSKLRFDPAVLDLNKMQNYVLVIYVFIHV